MWGTPGSRPCQRKKPAARNAGWPQYLLTEALFAPVEIEEIHHVPDGWTVQGHIGIRPAGHRIWQVIPAPSSQRR